MLCFLLLTLLVLPLSDLCPVMKNRIEKSCYVVDYNVSDKVPEIVYYVLHEETLHKTRRYDFYCSDTCSVNPHVYYKSGYDRGHMISSASGENPYETFDMVNIVPQRGSFNRGVWKRTEIFERTNCNPSCYVICGIIRTGHEKKLSEEVLVPEVFYKIVYNPELNSMIAFLLDQNSCGDLKCYAVPVDEIEGLTGIDFFYQIEQETQNLLEEKFDVSVWSW